MLAFTTSCGRKNEARLAYSAPTGPLTNERRTLAIGSGHPCQLLPSRQETEEIQRTVELDVLFSAQQIPTYPEISLERGPEGKRLLALDRESNESWIRPTHPSKRASVRPSFISRTVHRANPGRILCVPQVRCPSLRQSRSSFCRNSTRQHRGHGSKGEKSDYSSYRRIERMFQVEGIGHTSDARNVFSRTSFPSSTWETSWCKSGHGMENSKPKKLGTHLTA